MDVYDQVQARITAVPHLTAWPDTRFILDRAVNGRPKNWLIPLVSCRAVGGDVEDVIPVIAALACFQLSIIMIDDLLDEDPDGIHHQLGVPATANSAAAFQAFGFEVIAQSHYSAETQAALLRLFNEMVLTTSYGQYLDTQPLQDEADYWRQVDLKSGPFFGTAFHAGALAGGVDEETAVKIKELGLLYGKLIQIHDDLGDTLAQPASPDWVWERPSLPILFAQLVSHPEQARFRQLFQAIPDEAALAEAQEILIRSGAVSYCLHHIITGHQEAIAMLDGLDIQNKTDLNTLLTELIDPVNAMFAVVG